jgi:Zn-dependent protease with chaperone function
MALRGVWFDGKTSMPQSVVLRIDDTDFVCVVNAEDQSLMLRTPFSDIKVTSRIGNTPRYLYFPNGEKCETRDHQVIDQWLQQLRPSLWNSLAHQLESHTYFVALTLVLVVAFVWAMTFHGLPAATRYIAFQLPQSVMDRAATETMQLLDKTHFHPTKLDEKTRARLMAHFAPALFQNKNLNLKVSFRGGGAIGANAFALPDGTVVFTDEIVHLAKNDDELLAVLAHEIGHVKYRHAMRSAIQGSVISFGVAMLTGDLSAASNLLAGLPVLITTMSYSRNFEREADDNSLVFLDTNHIARHHFVDLMERLTYTAECEALMKHSEFAKYEADKQIAESAKLPDDVEKNPKTDNGSQLVHIEAAHKQECDKLIAEHKSGFFDAKVMGYFASHPETKERTAKFKKESGLSEK